MLFRNMSQMLTDTPSIHFQPVGMKQDESPSHDMATKEPTEISTRALRVHKNTVNGLWMYPHIQELESKLHTNAYTTFGRLFEA